MSIKSTSMTLVNNLMSRGDTLKSLRDSPIEFDDTPYGIGRHFCWTRRHFYRTIKQPNSQGEKSIGLENSLIV